MLDQKDCTFSYGMIKVINLIITFINLNYNNSMNNDKVDKVDKFDVEELIKEYRVFNLDNFISYLKSIWKVILPNIGLISAKRAGRKRHKQNHILKSTIV